MHEMCSAMCKAESDNEIPAKTTIDNDDPMRIKENSGSYQLAANGLAV